MLGSRGRYSLTADVCKVQGNYKYFPSWEDTPPGDFVIIARAEGSVLCLWEASHLYVLYLEKVNWIWQKHWQWKRPVPLQIFCLHVMATLHATRCKCIGRAPWPLYDIYFVRVPNFIKDVIAFAYGWCFSYRPLFSEKMTVSRSVYTF